MLLLAACSSESTPAAVEQTITATDVAFDVTRFEATAGQPVKVTLQNEGALEHDFSILEIPHSGEPVVEGSEEGEMEHDMGAMAEEPEIHVAAPAGGSGTVEFTPSEPGEYEFFCSVTGHRDAGMKGTLVVNAS